MAVTPILPCTDANIRKAARALAEGHLAAFPTETVYGLGADAFNVKALAAVFAAKGRPRFDPLIIHIAEYGALARVAALDALSAWAARSLGILAERFWPGPLSIVLPKRPEVPDLATAGLGTAAIRFPSHPAAQKLIRWSTGAVAAPSANRFGKLSPTRAEHVYAQLGDSAGLILDGGAPSVGLESTVVDLSGTGARLLRPGGVPLEAIEDAIGPIAPAPAAGGGERGAASPGLLNSHYAPSLPLALLPEDELASRAPAPGEGYLFFSGAALALWRQRFPNAASPQAAPAWALSETGDCAEAACRLFETLHVMERLPLRVIFAAAPPPVGLGLAICDRLSRAAAPRD
ncbi:MAG: threonylcarbamoyl-AMP synthase [Treponema sp.]|nr:threonylcarbamoyl-AMP synthase [Treponema sp.]